MNPDINILATALIHIFAALVMGALAGLYLARKMGTTLPPQPLLSH